MNYKVNNGINISKVGCMLKLLIIIFKNKIVNIKLRCFIDFMNFYFVNLCE